MNEEKTSFSQTILGTEVKFPTDLVGISAYFFELETIFVQNIPLDKDATPQIQQLSQYPSSHHAFQSSYFEEHSAWNTNRYGHTFFTF